MIRMNEKHRQILINLAKSKIESAKANIEILSLNPVGVAEHPDSMETILAQVKIIAEQQDVIDVLESE
jgi:hypothetical protein